MTDSSDTPNIEEWVDRIILDLVHKGSFMQKGKTINAGMFPEAKQALLAKFQEVDETARVDEQIWFKDKLAGLDSKDRVVSNIMPLVINRIFELTNKSDRTTL